MDLIEEAINALYVDIGSRIRQARKRHEWNQADLAQAVGLTRSSVANLEAGRQRSPVHITLLIARVLDVPAETLLPSAADLDKLVKLQPGPPLDLKGQPTSTLDFVTTTVLRATGGRAR